MFLTTTCPFNPNADSFGMCYLFRYYDACEMLYGSCDCESGRTKCCEYDECKTTTVPPTSTSFILIEK
jgi:hypothetical protein